MYNYIWENENRLSINYNGIVKIENSLGLVPYYGFGGYSNLKEIEKHYGHLSNNRIHYSVYFIKCINSLMQYCENIIVSVQNDLDYKFVSSIKECLGLNYGIVYNKCKSIDNPISLLIHIQNNRIHKEYKYILYTECDQILYFDSKKYIQELDENKYNYISFHRLLENYMKDEISHKQFNTNTVALFDNKEYFVCCWQDMCEYDDFFTFHTTNAGAYGGAYLCTSELFDKIKFQLTDNSPCESASHQVFQCADLALKTIDPYNGFIINLSGISENLNLNNIEIKRYPSIW